MLNKPLKIINKHTLLTQKLIQLREYKTGLNFKLNNIKNAKTYKLWQKLKRIKHLIKIILFISKRNKTLSLNNVFITIIIDFKDKQTTKITEFIQSIFSQTYPNIELVCLVSKKNTKSVKNLFESKSTNVKSIKFQNINILSTINQIKSKYICYIKPIYLLHPNYLEKCIIKMEFENLDICSSEISSSSIKNKKKHKINVNKPIISPGYAVIKKKYIQRIIDAKKSTSSKINEPLVKNIYSLK